MSNFSSLYLNNISQYIMECFPVTKEVAVARSRTCKYDHLLSLFGLDSAENSLTESINFIGFDIIFILVLTVVIAHVF
jgi:hypothetical protein